MGTTVLTSPLIIIQLLDLLNLFHFPIAFIQAIMIVLKLLLDFLQVFAKFLEIFVGFMQQLKV